MSEASGSCVVQQLFNAVSLEAGSRPQAILHNFTDGPGPDGYEG